MADEARSAAQSYVKPPRSERRRLTQPEPRDQEDLVALRDSDPVAWLRDKAMRRVPIDTRGALNAAAVLEVCERASRV
jgi:hypothetical protein